MGTRHKARGMRMGYCRWSVSGRSGCNVFWTSMTPPRPPTMMPVMADSWILCFQPQIAKIPTIRPLNGSLLINVPSFICGCYSKEAWMNFISWRVLKPISGDSETLLPWVQCAWHFPPSDSGVLTFHSQWQTGMIRMEITSIPS
jgi:hypothetical protein